MSELMTLEQFAAVMNVSVNTVRYWRSIGYGPKSARIGRRVVYRRVDVDAWVDAHFDEDSAGGAA